MTMINDVQEQKEDLIKAFSNMEKEQLSDMLIDLIGFLCEKGKESAELTRDMNQARRLMVAVLVGQFKENGSKSFELNREDYENVCDASITVEDDPKAPTVTITLRGYKTLSDLDDDKEEKEPSKSSTRESTAEGLIAILKTMEKMEEILGNKDKTIN